MNPPPNIVKPWRKDFKEAAMLCAAGATSAVAGLYVLWRHTIEPGSTSQSLAVGGTLLLTGIAFWRLGVSAGRRGYVRLRGTRTERTAVDDLIKALPRRWTVRAGVPSPAGGDIDVYLTNSSGEFVIEIKSPENAWGCDSWWRRMSGIGIDPLAEQAIVQAKQNATTVSPSTIAVVWLPRARRFSGMRHGALIVGGNAKYLIKQLT